MRDVRMAVAGAAGRMGRALVQAIARTEGAVLSGALEAEGHPDIGKDIGGLCGLSPAGVALSGHPESVLAASDVLIDFSSPKAAAALAGLAAKAGAALVIGTTGLSADAETAILAAAKNIAVVKSGNMSLGVCLLTALVKKAAAVLPDFDIEIVEMHHNKKADAPSGTALMLGKAAAAGRDIMLEQHSVRGRDGIVGPRKAGDIGFAALRGGTVIGEHQVIFAGEKERVVLSHIAEDRTIFAGGAVKCALWAKGRPAGLYGIADVLGLESVSPR
jgi:4-hydroxy-tetrahydrodipicolinate reductase